jgi:hypothetical protein
MRKCEEMETPHHPNPNPDFAGCEQKGTSNLNIELEHELEHGN